MKNFNPLRAQQDCAPARSGIFVGAESCCARLFPESLRKNVRAVLLAYAAVIFSGNLVAGALLCAASLLCPWIGLAGLLGTIIALGAARAAGFERAAVEDGRLLFNSLLCCLALGCWAPPGSLSAALFGVLLVAVSLAALACAVLLNQMTLVLVGTASRSLAYCMVGAGLNWLLTRLIPTTNYPANTVLMNFTIPVPAVVDLWAHALGTFFFSPTVLAGLIATVALGWASRLSLVYGLVGFGVSAAILFLLGFSLPMSPWLQLDAILCAIALGGVFFVPSRASMLLAALGSAMCVLLGVALAQGLRWIDAPLLTLPFNLVVLGISGALRWRVAGREPRATLFPGKNPEATFRADQLWRARNPEADLPAIALPFDGIWVVTQGFDDQPTHQGAWRHGLDFELADANLRPDRSPEATLADFPTYGAPLVSPVDGRVVRLVDAVEDNDIGGNNFAENWGNSIVIEIAPGLHVQLSHFRRRGFKVREGDRVRHGQLLGYLGNSGRSPVPHLHLQMQVLPEVGSPTIPFRLLGYRTPGNDGQWSHHFRGLPQRDEAVAGARRHRWVDECFAPGDQTEREYRVFTARGEERETIRREWTPGGGLILHSLDHGARARLVSGEGHFTPVEFSGSRKSLLAVFAGAGRIPLTPAVGLQWTDFVDPSCGVHWARKWVDDVIGPFLGRTPPACHAEVISCDSLDEKFAIRWTAPGAFKTELHFAAAGGLISGRLETQKHWIHFLAVDTVPEILAAPQTSRAQRKPVLPVELSGVLPMRAPTR